MNELEYYNWCLTYVTKIPLFASVYSTRQVVSEQCSPTTLESIFEFIMKRYLDS